MIRKLLETAQLLVSEIWENRASDGVETSWKRRRRRRVRRRRVRRGRGGGV